MMLVVLNHFRARLIIEFGLKGLKMRLGMEIAMKW